MTRHGKGWFFKPRFIEAGLASLGFFSFHTSRSPWGYIEHPASVKLSDFAPDGVGHL